MADYDIEGTDEVRYITLSQAELKLAKWGMEYAWGPELDGCGEQEEFWKWVEDVYDNGTDQVIVPLTYGIARDFMFSMDSAYAAINRGDSISQPKDVIEAFREKMNDFLTVNEAEDDSGWAPTLETVE